MSHSGWRLTDEPDGVLLVIPSKTYWLETPFYGMCLCAWAGFEALVLHQLLFGMDRGWPMIFVSAWLIPWTLVGLAMVYSFLWGLGGREVIAVKGMTLRLSREILGLGPSWDYDLARIRDLRTRDAPFEWLCKKNFPGLAPQAESALAFDYGAKTVLFGYRLEKAQAKALVEELKRRLSGLLA